MIFSPTITPPGTWVLFRTKGSDPRTGDMTIKKWYGNDKVFTETSNCPFWKYMEADIWNESVEILEIKLSLWRRIRNFFRK